MLLAFPLLHVAQSAVEVTTVDSRFVAAAVAIYAGWLVWAVRPWRLARRTRRAAIRGFAAALVFLAVLPAVLPYDHLFVNAHLDGHGATAEAVHASHCHDTPGSCADAPVTAGPGQFLVSSPLMPLPALMTVLLLFALPALAGITSAPPVPPPLRLSIA